MIMEIDKTQNLSSDTLASQFPAGNDDIFASCGVSEVAGCENVNDAAEASWFSAGALFAPSLTSQ